LVAAGDTGFCGVRENRNGTLVSLVYGRTVAQNVDPIEKKPLYHFLPGSAAFSVATAGCNFRCRHCQNASISHPLPADIRGLGIELAPERIVELAVDTGCRTIAYTYTEPTIFFEYAFDTARCARERGLKNILVSNGYITAAALAEIAPYLDGINIDLKTFRDRTYRELCSARLEPVLDTIRRCRQLGIWTEVTTLIIPDWNDQPDELRDIAEFIAAVDPDMPWHISRFHPAFKMRDKPRTPVAVLETARQIGHEAGLHYVYPGNVGQTENGNTRCPHCRELVVERSAFAGDPRRMHAGACPGCGTCIAGVWD